MNWIYKFDGDKSTSGKNLSKSELCVIDSGLLFSFSFIFIVLFEIKKLDFSQRT